MSMIPSFLDSVLQPATFVQPENIFSAPVQKENISCFLSDRVSISPEARKALAGVDAVIKEADRQDKVEQKMNTYKAGWRHARNTTFEVAGVMTTRGGLTVQSGVVRNAAGQRLVGAGGYNLRVSDTADGGALVVTEQGTRQYDKNGILVATSKDCNWAEGTELDDIILETRGAKGRVLNGRGGNDTIVSSFTGSERVFIGGSGNDRIILGGAGKNLRIEGGAGDDSVVFAGDVYHQDKGKISAFKDVVVDGGAGDDHVQVATGSIGGDTLVLGGDGNDNIKLTYGDGNVSVFGGTGDDFVQIKAKNVDGSISVSGGDGNDSVQIDAERVAGNLSVSGDRGNDFVHLKGQIYIQDNLSLSGGAGQDRIVTGNIDNAHHIDISGDDGDDSITTGNLHATGNVNIVGGEGNDSIATGNIHGDNVHISGGTGDDTMRLGRVFANYVRFLGDKGNDVMIADYIRSSFIGLVDGGDGDDTIKINHISNMTVSGGTGKNTISIQQAMGSKIVSEGNDNITVDVAVNSTFVGGAVVGQSFQSEEGGVLIQQSDGTYQLKEMES